MKKKQKKRLKTENLIITKLLTIHGSWIGFLWAGHVILQKMEAGGPYGYGVLAFLASIFYIWEIQKIL